MIAGGGVGVRMIGAEGRVGAVTSGITGGSTGGVIGGVGVPGIVGLSGFVGPVGFSGGEVSCLFFIYAAGRFIPASSSFVRITGVSITVDVPNSHFILTTIGAPVGHFPSIFIKRTSFVQFGNCA